MLGHHRFGDWPGSKPETLDAKRKTLKRVPRTVTCQALSPKHFFDPNRGRGIRGMYGNCNGIVAVPAEGHARGYFVKLALVGLVCFVVS